MPFFMERNDITRMKVDAIVNAANSSLLGGGGVDGSIHRAAGPELLAECRTLGGCRTGEAKLTKGYKLPAKYVIHTVGPIWQDGRHGEPELLESCYRESLRLAWEYGCETVAFPLISAGVYGYPKKEAIQVASDTIRSFLEGHDDMVVTLVLFGKTAFHISRYYVDVKEFIDDTYVEKHTAPSESKRRAGFAKVKKEICSVRDEDYPELAAINSSFRDEISAPAMAAMAEEDSLEDALKHLDEGFVQMLFRKIDELGITDAECYKRANLTRQHFSKIRSDADYRPKKATAVALAFALRLERKEFEELLMKAGYALSGSTVFDTIILYSIKHKIYDVDEINGMLYDYDQILLGNVTA